MGRIERLEININGIVQGIGFRPFVYNLAKKNKLRGYVCNTSQGVLIDVEGNRASNFLDEITNSPPPLAKITSIKTKKLKTNGYKDFRIIESKREDFPTTIISPDISICDDCIRELYDKNNPRYQHPFINCTNCGPRYTILERIPYDRKNTSMKKFPMCKFCEGEYGDITNRRFHAQPVCCPNCGPRLKLIDKNKREIKGDPIGRTVVFLKKGKIIAIKGIGGFHLACDAVNSCAVKTLRKRKQRDEKPFAIMSWGLDDITKYAYVEKLERSALYDRTRPIVLIRKKREKYISQLVSINNNYFGVMLPYTPLHYLLFRKDIKRESNFLALVMTSGNISNEPICIKNDEAFERLGHIADYFLIHDREINTTNDDSIVSIMNKICVPVRRSRGFSPQPIVLKKELKRILGVGGELKNTICLTKGNFAILSHYVGDLENTRANNNLERTVDQLKEIYKIEPEIIAHDLHPNYFSTNYAKGFASDCQLVGVQHHHAHIASLMAENDLNEDVIGIALDGTGYGLDGNIWGGEVFIGSLKKFSREYHLEYMPLAGGDSSIKEPWKIGASYLYSTFGNSMFNLGIDFLKKHRKEKLNIICRMIDKGINTIETSSMGRFFDAVSSLIGIKDETTYEGQAAMELESFATQRTKGFYDFEVTENEILIKGIIEQIVKDLCEKKKKHEISTKFHNTICEFLGRISISLRKKYKINKVFLSGGCFQNRFLTQGLVKRLKKDRFDVYTHRLVPPNDGGIALGQVLIANAMLK